MKKFLFICIFYLSLCAQQSEADATNPLQSATYSIGDGNIVTMNINLWGHVKRPGAYQIPITFGLLELISNAGGPSGTANLDDVKIVRKGNEVLRVNLSQYILTGDERVLKKLQPGDTVVIGGSLGNVFSDVLGYLRDIALVVTSIALISR